MNALSVLMIVFIDAFEDDVNFTKIRIVAQSKSF